VSGDLAAEFPGLRADWLICQCSDHSCDPGVGERLALLASRFNGRQALELRQQQVPAAYRSFFRQVGIDPEQQPTPIEQAVLGRLLSGGNLPQDRISDGLLLALLETSVPVVAFEAGVVAPPISIRGAEQGELVAGDEIEPGALILADGQRPLCQLFSAPEPPFAPAAKSERLLLVAVVVPGVSEIASDEALNIAAAAISGD
jgi:DNA/RNA-binding domain of Phe-tRNA-synthetase-like protein